MKGRVYEIARNCKYDGCQRALESMFYIFGSMFYIFPDKKKTGLGEITRSKVVVSVNETSAEELPKPVIKKFKKRKVYAGFKDNI